MLAGIEAGDDGVDYARRAVHYVQRGEWCSSLCARYPAVSSSVTQPVSTVHGCRRTQSAAEVRVIIERGLAILVCGCGWS